MRNREYRLVNNRVHFRCPHCGAFRAIPVPPGLRRKSIRCQQCGQRCQCVLNRRNGLRELQSGKLTLVSGDRELDVFLYDVSPQGVGFLLPPGGIKSSHLSAGMKVRFKCNWNSRLLGSNYYEIRSVSGQRVGAQKCR